MTTVRTDKAAEKAVGALVREIQVEGDAARTIHDCLEARETAGTGAAPLAIGVLRFSGIGAHETCGRDMPRPATTGAQR